eukprot:9397028-Pyramimonas_sp.AAC.1
MHRSILHFPAELCLLWPCRRRLLGGRRRVALYPDRVLGCSVIRAGRAVRDNVAKGPVGSRAIARHSR